MEKLKIYCLLIACLFCSMVYAQNEEIKVSIMSGIHNPVLKESMEDNASLLLNILNKAAKEKKKPKLSLSIMTESTREKIEALWKTSMMECPKFLIEENCLQAAYGDYQIRNIPVIMFSASDSTKNEEIAINFQSDGKIDDIYITVDEHQYAKILGSSELVEDFVNRTKILDFVEKFRTAYNCKDIYYLENVFSNNALIITAKEIRQRPNSDQALRGLGVKEYEYQIQNKEQYLKNLKEKVFKKNAYLNIVFDSIKVLEHPGYKDIYGVSLKQYWNSSTYKDQGFLYLLIDCRKEFEMQIFVRAWHPEDYFSFASFSDMKMYSE